MARALVYDERRRVRQRLVACLAFMPELQPANTAASAEELRERYLYERPDIVLMGTQRADGTGLAVVRDIVAYDPTARVLVFGAADDEAARIAALACGARGFLSWTASPLEAGAALAHAMTLGNALVCAATDHGDHPITRRELQVLRGMSLGKSNGEIGRDLLLSEDAVKSHARRLFRKLGVRHRAHAVALGFRDGLVS